MGSTAAIRETHKLQPTIGEMASEIKREPLTLLLTLVALVGSSLELEILERLDGMRVYMTSGEIVWDASIAFLILFGFTLAWWLCLYFLSKAAEVIPPARPYGRSLFWYVGITVPLAYFAYFVRNAIRLWLYPQWHPGHLAFFVSTVVPIALCIACLWIPRLAKLQAFCRTRLSPIGWLHMIMAAAALVGLCVRGVHPLHDFVHPARAVAGISKPDIYLITVDALRADEMSLYGYARPTTPNLERFAQRAFVFDYFFANANFTTPATTSIETGRLPWTTGVFHLGGFVRQQGAPQETMAKVLQENGYYTAMISSNSFASPFQHRTEASYNAAEIYWGSAGAGMWERSTLLAGFNTLYTLSGPLLKPIGVLRQYLASLPWSNAYTGPEMAFHLTRSLVEREDIKQPRFIWTHIFPPHDPYIPPPPYRGRFLPGKKLTRKFDFLDYRTDAPPPGVSIAELRARYDEHLAYSDQTIGDFLNWLDQTGRLDKAIVIITADHGESFEHGWLTHGGPYLYSNLIHIPLLVHLPGQKQGSRISQAAEQIDLLPTILESVGVRAPSWSEGVSLVPALQGKPLPQRFLYSMNLESNSAFQPISQGTVAIMDNDFKFIERLGTQNISLYRYRTDPLDQNNVVDSEPAVTSRMQGLLGDKLRKVNEQSMPTH